MKNRLYLAWKHAPAYLPLVCMSLIFAAFRMIARNFLLPANAATEYNGKAAQCDNDFPRHENTDDSALLTVRASSAARWWLPDFSGIQKSREIFLMLLRRQFLARYQQSVLGILWAILNPFGSLFIFWLLFDKILHVPSENYPYVVFAFTGMIFWGVFQNACMATAGSLQEQMAIVSKVYFPRIILPGVSLARVGGDACISIVLVLIFNLCYGYFPGARLIFVPFVLLAALVCGLSLGLLVAGPIVRFRDLGTPLSYAVQLAMYITPVIYPPTLVPESLAWIIKINPMYWVIEWARWIFIGQPTQFTPFAFASALIVVCLLIAGWLIFARTERSIIDVQ